MIKPAVLIIAGSDSSGGAGLLRDVQTLADFEVASLCAITAVTAQSDAQLTSIHHLPPDMVRQQINAASTTRRLNAIKIGMLGTYATVVAVADALPSHITTPIVLDPVLASTSGGALLDPAGIAALREQLLPRATVVTPNLLEAAALLDTHVATDESTMLDQAQRILRMGPQAVLIKGGHAQGQDSVDLLLIGDQPPLWLTATRIDARLRGTGCALASAIAALLALGVPLHEACQRAKHYVHQALMHAATLAYELHDNIEQPAL